MEATIQKNKEEISFEGAEWKILIVGRIQSHFKITGCDSIKLTTPDLFPASIHFICPLSN